MNKFFSSLFLLFLFLFLFSSPHHVLAAGDLSITASSVRFSEEVLYAGDEVRIYATVKNYGDQDISAKVIFYQGALLIGKSQTVSVLANGGSDDVYVDYTLPNGTFNIRAVIQGQNPEDANSANDEAITGLFTTLADADRDGINDAEDNCKDVMNQLQENLDVDTLGDVCDADRDGDGVSNDADVYPDDATRSANPVVVSQETTTVPENQETDASVQTEVAENISEENVSVQRVQDGETSSEKDDTTVAQTDIVQDTADDSRAVASDTPLIPEGDVGIFGFGKLTISPFAQFSYRQIDWRTFEFTALATEGQGEISYAWDFGDGATSMQQTLTHAFPDAGEYTVTLAVQDEAGLSASDGEVFTISFFHLSNPWIQGTLGALFFLLLACVWIVMRLRNRSVQEEA